MFISALLLAFQFA